MTAENYRKLGASLIAIWMVGIAAFFVMGDQHSAATGAVLPDMLRATGIALLWLVVMLGAGSAVLGRWAPEACEHDLASVYALVVGLVVAGLLSLVAATALGVNPLTGTLVLLILGSGWFVAPKPRLPPLSPVAVGVGLLLLLPALTDVFAPPVDTDDVYYHLALPKQMLMEGALVGGPWAPNGSRPLALHLIWSWLIATGGSAAPRLVHWVVTGCVLAVVHVRARERFGASAGSIAPLILAGSYTFLSEAGLASTNLPATLCALIAFDALWTGRSTRVVAIACGGALAIKYTAAAVIVPIALLTLWQHRRGGLLTALGFIGLTSLFVLPWWLRNLAEGLHALFPYAGWGDEEFVFFWLEKYGMGRQWQDFLLLPWNLVMRAEIHQHAFLGRLNPLWLALLPAALWALKRSPEARPLAGVATAGFILWAAGPQWLRHLVPVLPIAALFIAAGHALLPTWARRAVWLAWLAGLPANWGPIFERAADHTPVALGHIDEQEWLRDRMTSARAIRWINEETPPNARVAMLFTWDAWHLERRWALGSVEDHVPPRYLLKQFGDRTLSALRQSGIEWVLFQEQRFLPSQYPFLEASQIDTLFNTYPEQMAKLLLREGELRFEARGIQVWWIGAPAPEEGESP